MNKRRWFSIVSLAFAGALALYFVPRDICSSSVIGKAVIASNAKVPAIDRALRPSYPYSVIPGGAYSPSELRYANNHDVVVQQHYAGFDLANVQLVKLTSARYQYVSFRRDNRIFWTRNKLRIPKGEVLLTDGTHYARTRCGNRLSNVPQTPTTAQQPPLWVLSLPPFRPDLLADREITLAPAPPSGDLAQAFPVSRFALGPPTLTPYLPPPSESIPPVSNVWPPIESYLPVFPISGGYLPSPGPGPAPIPSELAPTLSPVPPPVISEIPEPADLYLFILTLAASFWFLTRMLRRESNSSHPKTGPFTEDEN